MLSCNVIRIKSKDELIRVINEDESMMKILDLASQLDLPD